MFYEVRVNVLHSLVQQQGHCFLSLSLTHCINHSASNLGRQCQIKAIDEL